MALKVSALLSNVRVPLYTCSLHRTYFQGANFKFKHLLTPGTPHFVRKSATDPLLAHMNGPLKAKKVSTTAGLWMSSQGNGSFVSSVSRGCLRRIALGVALGVSAVILVRSLHTGTLTAMTHKVNLNSDEGDWKETKDFLLSLSGKERRQYYRTSNHVPLEDIPVWSPVGGESGKAFYPRNEKLNKKISLYSGDITKLEIDAIVNAAKETLLGGGGVDGAIHRAAGPMLKKECASLHGCQTGDAKLTSGYGLPAKFVIHTVGPIASGGVGEAERKALMSCYKNSLKQATKAAARSVAFPCISTGIYGYPNEQAVHEALAAVREYLDDHHDKLDRVIFCVFMPMDKKMYLQKLHLYFPSDSTVKSKL